MRMTGEFLDNKQNRTSMRVILKHFHFKGYVVVSYSIIPPSDIGKIPPLRLGCNVGFPIPQTMNFAAAQHRIGGVGFKQFLYKVEVFLWILLCQITPFPRCHLNCNVHYFVPHCSNKSVL